MTVMKWKKKTLYSLDVIIYKLAAVEDKALWEEESAR